MVVGGKYGDLIFFNKMAGLEIRNCHTQPKLPGFVAAGNDAAVVVAEHGHGVVPEIRPEDPLAGAVKAVAIDDGFHIDECLINDGRYAAVSQTMDHISHHTPDREFRTGKIDFDGRKPRCFRDEADLVKGLFETADQHLSV